eukprot:1858048-Pyramimonas_sp.AAC.1
MAIDPRDIPIPEFDDPDLDADFRPADRDHVVPVSHLFHIPFTQTTLLVADSRGAEPRPTGSTALGGYTETSPRPTSLGLRAHTRTVAMFRHVRLEVSCA